jgi:beta-galactosidase
MRFCVLNGHEVGMSETAKTPAEFNITPYLKKGNNLLAVQVFRWSAGTLSGRPGFLAHQRN